MSSNWICCQIGAREHYAVARALHRQQMLAGLVTDWYAFGGRRSEVEGRRSGVWDRCFGVSVFRCFAGRGRSAFSARADGIPDELVHAFPVCSLFWKWHVRRLAAQGRSHEAYLHTDAAFATAVSRRKLPAHDVFFGYSYASLEMLVAERKRGILTILDQIDPGAGEFELVAEEMGRFPQLAGPPPKFPAAYYDRNRREWELADRIVVNSEWSRGALVKQGVPAEKLVVVPLCYERKMEDGRSKIEGGEAPISDLRPSSSSLRPPAPLLVLFLGQVNVRKGVHYLMEAARMLESERIHFDIVGQIGILPAAVASAPRNMTFHGAVSRREAPEWYGKADVFVLPTLSDGFAITQLEAMAHGLPVIATANCGRVVEDGVTGFVVPPRDAQALAGALLKLVHSRNLVAEMSARCIEASRAFSIDAYGRKLVEIIENHSVPLSVVPESHV